MLEKYIIEEEVEMNYLAEVFPEKKLTLLHGSVGSGKSYSVIKAFNTAGIKPVYVAVEASWGLRDLDKYYTGESLFADMIGGKEIPDLKDQVVIIDTYTRVQTSLQAALTDEGIVNLFEKMVSDYDITLVIVGHTRTFVSRDGVFDDNIYLVRNSAEELFLEKKAVAKTKDRPAHYKFALHILKGRGNGGARVIDNWMRN